MFTPVAPILAAPPTTGLVVSAVTPPEGERWESGLAWVPERCGASYQLVPWCTVTDPDPFSGDGLAAVYYRPPGARFSVTCSTLGGGINSERVLRLVNASTPYLIARELWAGEMAQADPYDAPYGSTQTMNHWLAGDNAVTVGTAAPALAAIGRLEHSAGAAAHGQQIMLHIPRLVLPALWGYVRRVGPLLLTPTDNVVVADAGYDGSGPAGEVPGATVWAYATTVVQVRTSQTLIIDDPGQTVDRSTNTHTVWAERVWAATFDPCCHFATEITV
ncbi:MAG: hypothetical protein ACRDRO_21625 [Pseudonocardiaceae bacterium]